MACARLLVSLFFTTALYASDTADVAENDLDCTEVLTPGRVLIRKMERMEQEQRNRANFASFKLTCDYFVTTRRLRTIQEIKANHKQKSPETLAAHVGVFSKKLQGWGLKTEDVEYLAFIASDIKIKRKKSNITAMVAQHKEWLASLAYQFACENAAELYKTKTEQSSKPREGRIKKAKQRSHSITTARER